MNYSRRGSHARAGRSLQFPVLAPESDGKPQETAKDQDRGRRLVVDGGRGRCVALSVTAGDAVARPFPRPHDRRAELAFDRSVGPWKRQALRKTTGWAEIDKICRSCVSCFQTPFGTTGYQPKKGKGICHGFAGSWFTACS